MPKIRAIELPKWQTVERQLHETAIDLLPSDMVENPLVRWVTEYDSLIKKSDSRDNIDFLERSWYEDRGLAFIFNELANSALQTKLPFYFGTLFHIGRMRKVYQATLETISNMTKRESESFVLCASSLAEHLMGENTYSQSVQILNKLSDASSQYHSHQLGKAEQWWKAWQKEVEVLRNSVDSVNQEWGGNFFDKDRHSNRTPQAFLRLWKTATSPSELQMTMLAEGVRFKSTPPTTSIQGDIFGGQNWIMPLLFMSSSGDYEHFFHETRYILRESLEHERDKLRAEREQRIEPQVQIALSCLKSKYGDKNPFDEFKIGKRAATLTLRELVKENKLPNDRPSPWLHTWKQIFEDLPWSSEKFQKPKDSDGEWLQIALRQADSAIKKNITNLFCSNETWNQFIQRLFEHEWVEKIGAKAGEMNKKEKKSTTLIWSLDVFVDFIQKVIDKLNEIGYSLEVPAKSRLKTLLDKASRGDSFYGDDAW